jgi:ferredoxin
MFNSYVETSLRYQPTKCINCEICIDVCPHGVFIPGKKAVQMAKPWECMECGACQLNCPTSAITVDSGVGCAAAMIGAALRGKKVDQKEECT